MRMRAGSSSHVGQVREVNQDRSLTGDNIGVVADGMGGHAGGERASALAIAEFSGVRGVLSATRLSDVVRAANARVYEASMASTQLRGMGTTIVAATFDPDVAQAYVVNVGDSRAYLWRAGQFRQITLDHSLVEELLRQGRITAEEAQNHPQRNMVTRVLGIAADVVVDVFTVDVQPGDRILLCSDGLSNEVTDEAVGVLLGEISDPTLAAETLVNTAVANGGRDNVTVVVLAFEAEPGDDSPAVANTDVDEAVMGPSHGDTAVTPVVVGGDPLTTTRRPPKRGRFPVRGFMMAFAIVLVLAIAAGAITWYGRSAWFVDHADGEVVIMRGRPGGVLWIEPDQVEATGLAIDALDGASQQRVESRRVMSSLEQAQELVDNLVTTTTVTTPSSVPPTSSTTRPSISQPSTSQPSATPSTTVASPTTTAEG